MRRRARHPAVALGLVLAFLVQAQPARPQDAGAGRKGLLAHVPAEVERLLLRHPALARPAADRAASPDPALADRLRMILERTKRGAELVVELVDARELRGELISTSPGGLRVEVAADPGRRRDSYGGEVDFTREVDVSWTDACAVHVPGEHTWKMRDELRGVETGAKVEVLLLEGRISGGRFLGVHDGHVRLEGRRVVEWDYADVAAFRRPGRSGAETAVLVTLGVVGAAAALLGILVVAVCAGGCD